jgi:signal transduction histidine kinase
MLHDFLARERATIISTAKRKAQSVRWGRLAFGVVEESWDVFFDDLTGLVISSAEHTSGNVVPDDLGKEYLKLGFAITDAVQSYNIIYQSITEAAASQDLAISDEELGRLNTSLDIAIAQVVTQFERVQTKAQDLKENERLGFLAHELRNSLQSATIALEMIELGTVSIRSKTGGLLQSSLQRMADLIDNALTGVRLRVEPAVRMHRLRAFEVIGEVEVTAAFQARTRNQNLCIQTSNDIEVCVDRQLFVSALSNIVQNALKFTRAEGTVSIRAREAEGRILIEVEDECGGLNVEDPEQLFVAGVQTGADRTGVGLGLAISRQAIERNNGELRVQNKPGHGCIFVIDLPMPVKLDPSTQYML